MHTYVSELRSSYDFLRYQHCILFQHNIHTGMAFALCGTLTKRYCCSSSFCHSVVLTVQCSLKEQSKMIHSTVLLTPIELVLYWLDQTCTSTDNGKTDCIACNLIYAKKQTVDFNKHQFSVY